MENYLDNEESFIQAKYILVFNMKDYSDRDGFIWLDGEFVNWRDAKIHVISHGLHYGSSVFEGIRCYNNKVFKLKEHMDRFIYSGKVLFFDIPFNCNQLCSATEDCLKKNNLSNAYIRPVAWRGSENMGVTPNGTKIHVAIAAWDWGGYFGGRDKQIDGIEILGPAPYMRPDPRTAPWDAKAAGLYMICTISKGWAEDRGYADALMLDFEGNIAECTGANIFFIKDGILITPIADRFLNGITRQTVIELAKRNNIKVEERRILPSEIFSFEDCFITGTAAEITRVKRINFKNKDCLYGLSEVSKKLINLYSDLTLN